FHSPLAPVLEIIARHGADGFYRGEVAEAIVAEVRRGDGLITEGDLSAVKPVVRKPISGAFHGRTILSMPPPSSGGIALLESLNIMKSLEALPPDAGLGKLSHDAPLRLHLLAESFKHAFADRAAWLGDADFAKVPVTRLTSGGYANELARRIDLAQTQPPETYGPVTP